MPLRGKEIIPQSPGQREFNIFGLMCCFIVYCVSFLSLALHNIFYIRMARCSLFVLKVQLNTN